MTYIVLKSNRISQGNLTNVFVHYLEYFMFWGKVKLIQCHLINCFNRYPKEKDENGCIQSDINANMPLIFWSKSTLLIFPKGYSSSYAPYGEACQANWIEFFVWLLRDVNLTVLVDEAIVMQRLTNVE